MPEARIGKPLKYFYRGKGSRKIWQVCYTSDFFDTQFLVFFSDWYSHDSWNLAVLWHYLLPRIDRAENVSEVHPLRRDHPHHGMAFNGIVKRSEICSQDPFDCYAVKC